MTEKVCRLCLTTINENHQEIGENLKQILKLNLGITKETVACMECMNYLQVFLNLKATCVGMKERPLLLAEMGDNVSLDGVKTESTINPVFKSEMKCSFCTKSTENESLVSLWESKENMFLMDTLEKYIPELNIKNIEEPLTCETCLDKMQTVSNFLMNCADVEEKISKYIEIEGMDGKVQVELQDVQKFVFKHTLKFEHINELEQTFDQIQEEYVMKTEAEIKHEKEVDDLEQSIKTENIDIKTEDSNCDSFQEPTDCMKLDNDALKMPLYKCEICSYEAKDRKSVECHILTHKISVVKTVNPHETTHEGFLNNHVNHKNPSETVLYKCDCCIYETNNKRYLKRHMLTHLNPSEVTMYKCRTCAYEAKRKDHLREHELVHKSPSEITMFGCEACPFQTRRKNYLTKHILRVHISSSDLPVFKCDVCPYETRHKQYLCEHELIHRTSEIPMFKCTICEFETRHRSSIRMHSLTHKSPSEVTMFKCGLCTFQSRHKGSLSRHMSKHKSPSSPSGITMFKCEICPYTTKFSCVLERHKLRHENLKKYLNQ